MVTFQLFFQSREQVVVRRGQIRRIGWVIKTMEEKTCNSAHEQTPLSNDTIDSVLWHREVGRAKDLSARPRMDSVHVIVMCAVLCSYCVCNVSVPHSGSRIKYINETGNARITQHRGAFVQQLFQWKSNNYYIFWVRVCRIRYPARKTHAPYCHLWPVCLYSNLPHYLINGKIYDYRFTNINMFFDFLYYFCLKHFSF
jgi:hypothetical protein